MGSSAATTPADKAEAAHWLADEVERLRGLPYDDLAELAGRRQNREMHTASGRSLDLETQIAWDDDQRKTLYVTLNVWDGGTIGQAHRQEIAHDEFALSRDQHGGVLGPVRRREAVDHDPGRRNNRRLFYGVVVAIGWAAWGWENAGNHHFSSGATGFALVMTALWFIAIILTLWRWWKARPG